MIYKNELKYILELIDDEDEEVRQEVFTQLDDYYGILEEDVLNIMGYIPSNVINILNPSFENNRRQWLLNTWTDVSNVLDDYEKLELKLGLIGKYQSGFLEKKKPLTYCLDYLADEFVVNITNRNEINLAYYLFQQYGLTGNTKDYFHPLNSNLVETIESKKGLPISLVIIYMLVGKRLGFKIEGCNFPGHFLAQANINGEKHFIDCFDNGKILSRANLMDLFGDFQFDLDSLLQKETTGNMIITRVLRNLINAYKLKNDIGRMNFFLSILSITPQI